VNLAMDFQSATVSFFFRNFLNMTTFHEFMRNFHHVFMDLAILYQTFPLPSNGSHFSYAILWGLGCGSYK